jgi:hypothetical protein
MDAADGFEHLRNLLEGLWHGEVFYLPLGDVFVYVEVEVSGSKTDLLHFAVLLHCLIKSLLEKSFSMDVFVLKDVTDEFAWGLLAKFEGHWK